MTDQAQLDLWTPLEPPRSPTQTPRRFHAVTEERERELLEEGRHLTRREAERILARLGRS